MAPPRSSATLARPRNGWHSVFHTVTRAACPPRSPGAKKAPAGACATNLSGRADPRALTRKVAGCLELKMAPPRSSATLARPRNGWHSVFHTVTRAACPPRSPGAKKAPAGACATNLSGRADPRALTRKVAGCLELKMAPPRSSATLSPVPETAGTLYSTRSPVQPALRGVPEPRRLPPAPVPQTSQAGQTPVLSPGRWPAVWS